MAQFTFYSELQAIWTLPYLYLCDVRWRSEIHGGNFESAARLHAQSECDSLLADSNRSSHPLQSASLEAARCRPDQLNIDRTLDDDNYGSPCTLLPSDSSTLGS